VEDFVGAVFCPHALADGNSAYGLEKMLKFSSAMFYLHRLRTGGIIDDEILIL